jgi:hypothetical protein
MKTFNDVVEANLNEASASKNGAQIVDMVDRAVRTTRKGGVFDKQAIDAVGKGAANDVAAINKLLSEAMDKLEDLMMEIQMGEGV